MVSYHCRCEALKGSGCPPRPQLCLLPPPRTLTAHPLLPLLFLLQPKPKPLTVLALPLPPTPTPNSLCFSQKESKSIYSYFLERPNCVLTFPPCLSDSCGGGTPRGAAPPPSGQDLLLCTKVTLTPIQVRIALEASVLTSCQLSRLTASKQNKSLSVFFLCGTHSCKPPNRRI